MSSVTSRPPIRLYVSKFYPHPVVSCLETKPAAHGPLGTLKIQTTAPTVRGINQKEKSKWLAGPSECSGRDWNFTDLGGLSDSSWWCQASKQRSMAERQDEHTTGGRVTSLAGMDNRKLWTVAYAFDVGENRFLRREWCNEVGQKIL